MTHEPVTHEVPDGVEMLDGVEGVLLDIDDTLLASHEAFATGICAVMADYLPHLAPEQVAEAVAMWRADAHGYFRRYSAGELTQAQQRLARANEIHARFGAPTLGEGDFPAWERTYLAGFEAGWRAHDEAPGVVAELEAAGYALGSLTNGPREMQERKLEVTGLAAQVPVLVAIDDLGVGKPDPRVFLRACELLGTDPARTVYVGDELDVDALAARRASLHGVWLDRPEARRGGVFLEDPAAAHRAGVPIISTLAELPGLLTRAAR